MAKQAPDASITFFKVRAAVDHDGVRYAPETDVDAISSEDITGEQLKALVEAGIVIIEQNAPGGAAEATTSTNA